MPVTDATFLLCWKHTRSPAPACRIQSLTSCICLAGLRDFFVEHLAMKVLGTSAAQWHRRGLDEGAPAFLLLAGRPSSVVPRSLPPVSSSSSSSSSSPLSASYSSALPPSVQGRPVEGVSALG